MNFSPWKARAAALLSALLLAAAFPPGEVWLLTGIAMVPVLLAVWSRSENRAGAGESGVSPGLPRFRFWPGFRLGWWFGFVFFLATLWWVQYVTFPGMVALCAYLALYPAVGMGITGWLGMASGTRLGSVAGRIVVAAGCWMGLEWLRSVALSGFPWNGLAVPWFELHAARAAAAWTGLTGLSFFALLVPLVIAALIRLHGRRAGRGILYWVLLLAGVEMLFRSAGPGPSAEDAAFHKAVLIQPNLTMDEKMSPDPELQRQRYFDLVDQTGEALAASGEDFPELVVWPESAVPGYFQETIAAGAYTSLLDQGEFTLVTGADDEEWGKLYNSVATLRGSTDNYLLHPKVRLVPFGEFIPFRAQVPILEKMLGHLIPLDFSPGTSLEPMKVAGQPFSIIPLVCFEDTIGSHARHFIRPEPQVMVNVTNDNWFHQSPATDIHFVNARWRTAELHRTLVRSANTGVTAIVSPQGGVHRIPNFETATLAGWFHTGDSSITFYARHGDLFAKVGGGLSLALLPVCWFGRRRKSPAATGHPDEKSKLPPEMTGKNI